MQKIFSFFLLALFVVIIHPAPSTLTPSTRELIIICDCGNESIERITKDFDTEATSGTAMIQTFQEALTEGAAPILVTGQLMDFLVSCKDTAPALLKASKNDKEVHFYKACSTLNLDAFDIRRIDTPVKDATSKTPIIHTGVLYLIIPKSYLLKHGSKDAGLGLQISKFPAITVAGIRSQKTPENKNCSSYLVQQLPNIFITLPTASYKSESYDSSQYPYVWSIVLNGHGTFSTSANIQLQEALAKKQIFSAQLQEASSKFNAIDKQLKALKAEIEQLPQKIAALKAKIASLPFPQQKKELADFSDYKDALYQKHSSLFPEYNLLYKTQAPLKLKVELINQVIPKFADSSTIAGMNMPDFRNFIQFLNNRIVTSILVYISCSAGGQNFVDPYKEITSGNILDLKFTVVTTSSTEAIVSLATHLYMSSTGEVIKKISDRGSFGAFFKAMQDPKDPVEKIVSLLIQVPHEASGDITNFSTLPSIRTPHSSWVTVPTDNKNMFVLTKVKAVAQGNKPLVIKDKQVLLITPQEISFELSLPSAKFPAIISQHAGVAYHSFSKITTQASFTDVVKGFLPVEMKSSKLFYIKELVCGTGTYSDVMLFVNAPTQEVEGITITEQDNSIEMTTKGTLPLSNGILYTKNKTQSLGQLWNSQETLANMVATFKAAPLADAQKIKSAVFAYFNMPVSATNALEAQKKMLVTALEKQQKGVLPPAKYLITATDTKQIVPKPAITVTAKMNPATVLQLAESLHLLAQYSAKK